MLAAMKVRGLSVYDTQGSVAGHLMPTSVSDIGARHKGYGGGNLRAAVFGVNDGLVSNTSLIMGVAGAAAGADIVLTSGMAGLLAGALSMAAGEYVSMRSQREMFEYQIGLERDELHEYPEEEAEELALIYQARGMQLDRGAARQPRAGQERGVCARRARARGTRPQSGRSRLALGRGASIRSWLSLSAPSCRWCLSCSGLPLQRAVTVAAVTAGVALFGVGAALSLFTGRSAVAGGLRMVLIGGGAGVATWVIGSLLGAAISRISRLQRRRRLLAEAREQPPPFLDQLEDDGGAGKVHAEIGHEPRHRQHARQVARGNPGRGIRTAQRIEGADFDQSRGPTAARAEPRADLVDAQPVVVGKELRLQRLRLWR